MEPNPYESPREIGGYTQAKKRLAGNDALACLGVAIMVHVVIQAIIHAVGIIFFT